MVNRRFILLSIACLVISLSTLSFITLLLPGNIFAPKNKVLLISFDGFRHDYIEKVKASGGKTPNFDYMIQHGSRIMRMENAFPTITLPNHQTLVTGMYTENHGIVLNTFIDANFSNQRFDMNNQDNLNDKRWFEKWPEPIWVTLQKKGRLSASHLWPLTDAPIADQIPYFQESQFTLLDNSIVFPFWKRVDDTIRWLSDKRNRIDLAMLYFPQPDEEGHSYGPDSSNMYKMIESLDLIVGRLIKGLRDAGLQDTVDVILTSDHGMSAMSTARQIPMDEYVNPSWYTYTLLTPVGALYPVSGKEQAVYNALKGKNAHLQVYWRHEVPDYLHYNHDNGRIAPLIVFADNGWDIVHKRSTGPVQIFGNHGFAPNNTDVQPVFIAMGPSLKINYTEPLGHSVDVYSLMCHLLGLAPNPNDGNFTRISGILRNPTLNTNCRAHCRVMRYLRSDTIYLIMVGLSFFLMGLVMFMLLGVCCHECARISAKRSCGRLQSHSGSEPSKVAYHKFNNA